VASEKERDGENGIYLKKWAKTDVSMIFELSTGDI